MLIAVWISNCTVSYIIYNCVSFAVLILFMSLYLSALPQLCTFLLPVSSGTLLMIKACSMRPLKSLLLIYSILVPKHPSISPFFHPTQFSCHSFHQSQLTSPSLLSIESREVTLIGLRLSLWATSSLSDVHLWFLRDCIFQIVTQVCTLLCY